MPPWRDVRGERRLAAQFIDGSPAGTSRTVGAAPDGNPPPRVSVDADDPATTGTAVVYELVSWGDTPARYRVRD